MTFQNVPTIFKIDKIELYMDLYVKVAEELNGVVKLNYFQDVLFLLLKSIWNSLMTENALFPRQILSKCTISKIMSKRSIAHVKRQIDAKRTNSSNCTKRTISKEGHTLYYFPKYEDREYKWGKYITYYFHW